MKIEAPLPNDERVKKQYSCRWVYKDTGTQRTLAADALEAARKTKKEIAERLGYMESCIEVIDVEIPT